jgi:dTDP-4-dehydrorhamnose reductase|tara:strand:+ start:3783 stop:4481 length:699 start_codon:yes stop_codon:yes gene_type:complete
MELLVLGHKGMLGHMVVKFLKEHYNIHTISTRWPECKSEILEFKGDYIINCIGAIPQRINNFDINWYLPIWLDLNVRCRVIHPGTDCEMDDDNYGISKRIAADYIREHGKQTKSIKTSIIGPELNSNASLLEWFLSQEGEVFGYTNALWNGNTTLEWAKQCFHLMNNWNLSDNETIISSTPISKYNLLRAIKDIFDKDIIINKQDKGTNKCLNGTIHTGTIQKQLIELKKFI